MSDSKDESYTPSYESVSASQELQDELHERQVTPPSRQNAVYSLENLQFGKKLGRGAFGTIFMAQDMSRRAGSAGSVIAVKCISKRRVAKRRLLKQLGLEISAHRSLLHPNILRFYNFQQDSRNVYFFLEYAAFGDLLRYVEKEKPGEPELASIFYQLGRALEYCHQMALIHRDFKQVSLPVLFFSALTPFRRSENCMITADRVPKLSDFGYCDKTDSNGNCKNPMFCGTTSFMPPEMIDEQPCSFSADVWSFGVTIFDILVGFTPFEGSKKDKREDKRAESRRREETYGRIRRIQVPWKDRTVARQIRNCEPLLRAIFVMPPEARPTMTEILEDSWFDLGRDGDDSEE